MRKSALVKNDFDRIAEKIDEIMEALAGNAHEHIDESDSVTITKDGFIKSVVRIQRLRNWVQGHADTRRKYNDN